MWMDLIDFNEEKRNIFQTSDISKNVFKLYVTFMSLQTLETDFNKSNVHGTLPIKFIVRYTVNCLVIRHSSTPINYLLE